MEYLLTILTIVGIYCILGLALNLHFGYTNLPNFGIAGFFAIGAYTSAILTVPYRFLEMEIFAGFPGGVPGRIEAPFIVGILAATVLSGFVGFLIGIPVLRLREDYLAVASIGVAEAIHFIALNELWLTIGSAGIRLIPMPFANRYLFFLIVLLVLAIVYWVISRLVRSPFGRVWRATREDETVTASLGKSIVRSRMWAWVIGCAFMGSAGSLWAHYAMAIQPGEFVPTTTFLVWIFVIVGGLRNQKGVLIGALVIIGLFEQGTRFLPAFGAPYVVPALRLIIIGVLLVVFIRFRPEGVLPERATMIEDHMKTI
jgi:branched-chain amino acid transport system permease protein